MWNAKNVHLQDLMLNTTRSTCDTAEKCHFFSSPWSANLCQFGSEMQWQLFRAYFSSLGSPRAKWRSVIHERPDRPLLNVFFSSSLLEKITVTQSGQGC